MKIKWLNLFTYLAIIGIAFLFWYAVISRFIEVFFD